MTRRLSCAALLALVAACPWQSKAACVDPRAVRITLDKAGASASPSADCRVWAGAASHCDAFHPERGSSSVWVEDRDVISPSALDVAFDRACENELVMPVVPAGRVSVTTDTTVELVHIAGLERSLERTTESTARVLMPLGPAIGIALDKQDRVVAVSRAFTVRADDETTFDWESASASATVLTFDIAPDAVGEQFELLANDQTRPDVVMTHRGRHLAIWYDLTAPETRIAVTSQRVHMEPVIVTPDRLRVVHAHASIRPLPALTVNVAIPDEVRFRLDDATLMISDAAANTSVARSEEVSLTQRFEYLPPKVTKVVLEIGGHKLTRTANLSDGGSRAVDFDLQPYGVSGVVSYGEERAKARIEFRRDESVHAATDATGRYELVLWEGGKYVAEVRLEDAGGVPSHLDLVDIEQNTTTLDFRIPKAEHRVRVVDDQTGAPIERALITVFNSWEDAKHGARRVGRNVATGADGQVLLPGLRPGTAVVHASASGYHGAQPIELFSGAGRPARTIEIRLRPREATRKLAVVMPDGAPAAGARLSALASGAPAWSGISDADGSVAMPSTLQADVLLASHPNTSLHASRWVDGTEPLTITLPPSAPPVVVKVVRDDGSPARHAQITIWLDGIAIRDPALTVFTGSIATTDADGVWLGRNLPPAALRVAPVQSRSRTNDALQSLSTLIPFPRPDTVTVRSID